MWQSCNKRLLTSMFLSKLPEIGTHGRVRQTFTAIHMRPVPVRQRPQPFQQLLDRIQDLIDSAQQAGQGTPLTPAAAVAISAAAAAPAATPLAAAAASAQLLHPMAPSQHLLVHQTCCSKAWSTWSNMTALLLQPRHMLQPAQASA
jgi:hypothetical protein